jgi:hypothetical protein
MRSVNFLVKLARAPMMLSRFTFLLGAMAMFGLAIAGVVTWASGFVFLKEALLEGVPYFFGTNGSQIRVPGRLLGTLAVIVPVIGAVGGIWLLRLAFEREQ